MSAGKRNKHRNRKCVWPIRQINKTCSCSAKYLPIWKCLLCSGVRVSDAVAAPFFMFVGQLLLIFWSTCSPTDCGWEPAWELACFAHWHTHTHWRRWFVCGLRHSIFVLLFVFGHPLRLIYLAKISEFSGDLRSLLRSALPSGLSFAHRRDSRVATRKNGRARQKYTHTPTHTHGKLMFFFAFSALVLFCPSCIGLPKY